MTRVLCKFNHDEIVPGLHQGGFPLPWEGPGGSEFSTIVLCAEELQYPADLYPRSLVIHCPLDDDRHGLPPHMLEAAFATGRRVASLVRQGRRNVLVSCHMGHNRSGLVMGVALLVLNPHRSAAEIVSLIQSRRQGALRNPNFVNLLGAFQMLRG